MFRLCNPFRRKRTVPSTAEMVDLLGPTYRVVIRVGFDNVTIDTGMTRSAAERDADRWRLSGSRAWIEAE